LDYPGVGPEHAMLRDSGRARYEAVTDVDALHAFRELARLEGIVPALEPSHAVAWFLENAHGQAARLRASPAAPVASRLPDEAEEAFDVLTLSGRGDKDLDEALERLEQLDG
ncbi:MAG: hypothetical protein ACXWDP_05270, partial [Solirubrobacterales bacterium]